MASHYALDLLISLLWLCTGPSSQQQIQSSQSQGLLQIRKQLEYPKQLEVWKSVTDPCSVPSSHSLTLTCEGNSVVELRIVGDKVDKLSGNYDGYSVPNQTLSRDFSFDSLVTTLSRLTSLRVVILVSLGMWGRLPDKIHRLYALEVLDLSSNFIYGTIPPKVSTMGMLHTLILDGNFLNGTVPEWFDSLTNLTVLSLKSNKLMGPLPCMFGAIRTLTSLALAGNCISGALPDMSGLASLEMVDLSANELDSHLPPMPEGLETVLLGRNSFTGEIPLQFGKMEHLQHLDLSFNLLEGCPLAVLFSLPNISYLNLASNMFNGSLPKGLRCSSQLGFVDISSNMLIGELPSCLNPGLNKRVVKFSSNCMAVDPMHQHEAISCREAQKKPGTPKGGCLWLLIGLIGGTTVLTFLSLLVFLLCLKLCRRKATEEVQALSPKPEPDRSPTTLATSLLANARLISQKQKLGTYVLPTHREFLLEELQEATNNFHQSASIGEGSTQKLYKGRLENGSYVAIKCLSIFRKDSVRNLKLRLDLLSKLRHPHLVCILGHCIDSALDDSNVKKVFLVYEYLPNGNLRSLLSDNSIENALKWPDRLAILIGIAKAVHFLHSGIIPGFFNNRLKTNNILLDEHYTAKISDYGLSIITDEADKHEMEGRKDTHAVQSNSSAWDTANLEDDVYTFGFILLEALVGPSIIERGEAFFLTGMAAYSSGQEQEEPKHLLDPIVIGTATQESLSIVVSLTNKCVSPDPFFRPSIEDVLWNLQYAAQVQAASDADQRSDVTS